MLNIIFIFLYIFYILSFSRNYWKQFDFAVTKKNLIVFFREVVCIKKTSRTFSDQNYQNYQNYQNSQYSINLILNTLLNTMATNGSFIRRSILSPQKNNIVQQPYKISTKEMANLITVLKKQERAEEKGKNRGSRDMRKCFYNGQLIRHKYKNNTWTGTYNRQNNTIVDNSTSYKTPSRFSDAHYKKFAPHTCSKSNGWKRCEIFSDGKWCSIFNLSEKYNMEGLRISNNEAGFWKVAYYHKNRKLWKAFIPGGGKMITTGPSRGKFETPLEAAIALKEYCLSQNIEY
jgi:hypothetical protein